MYVSYLLCAFIFFCKQKTAYEMRISDWSSDVCSSDLAHRAIGAVGAGDQPQPTTFLRLWVSLLLVAGCNPGVLGKNPDLQEMGHRSEEHTSELQSLMRISYAVFCLKKKKYIDSTTTTIA